MEIIGTRGSKVRCLTLTVLIDESPEAHANDTPEIAARLPSAAAVRVKVHVAERIRKSEIATVGVNDVDEGGVGPGQVAILAAVHVQRISRVQSGDSAYLKARLSITLHSASIAIARLDRPSD